MRKIEYLELEITSRCNAQCIVCPRYDNGILNKNFIVTDLTPETLQRNFTTEILSTIKSIILKGTIGDAGFHPNLDGVLDLFADKSIFLHTNGSSRTSEWWHNVAKKYPNLRVRFCLDGLDFETHFLYRKTNFNKVLENARSFIAGGGIAEWFFIIFRHNQHQINDCLKLAKDYGFSKFTAIYSDRYGENFEEPVNFTTNLNHILWTNVTNFDWPTNEIKTINFYNANQNKLQCCPNLKNNVTYIGSDGTVWPCCYYGSSNMTKDDMFWKLIQNKVLNKDPSRININERLITDIMNDPIWKWWDDYVSVTNPKKCQQYCG